MSHPYDNDFGFVLDEETEGWRADALCLGLDSNLFFPKKGGKSKIHADIRKQYCHNCPVRQDCLDYAIHNNIDFGIWGGMTPRQRDSYKREQRQFSKPGRPRAQFATCRHADSCGTPWGYVDGCRGDACYQAMSDFQREKRQRREAA